MSGLIPSGVGDALKKADAEASKPRRESGEYLVEVTSVGLADNPTSWIEKAIMVDTRFLDDIGGEHKVRIELSPCTGRDGEISEGKIRFLGWQLRALGLDPDEIAFQLFGLIGNTYKARYTVDNGLDENGEPKFPNAKLNPHTGKPYVNRDLVFLEKVEAPADAEAPDPAPVDEVPEVEA
jgi:hypothetical protein